MPISQTLKKLYLAKCIKELQEKASVDPNEFKNIKTNKLCKSAEKVLHEGKKTHRLQDEELAFVYFFKFVDLVLLLKKRKDFETCGNAKYLQENVEQAFELADVLKKSLIKRYDALKEANVVKEIEKVALTELQEKEYGQKTEKNVEETNPQNSMTSAITEHSITPSALFSIMRDLTKSFVIMDVRPGDDFDMSHIKHDSCINIPEEIVKPGITARVLEGKLPYQSLRMWKERNKVDYVILVDWSTMETCLPKDHPLQTVERAMCKWDETPLGKPPLILVGGYKDWVIHYPMFTTKALDIYSLDEPEEISSLYDVSGVDYPDLDEDEPDILSLNKKNKRASALIPDNTSSNELLINGWVNDCKAYLNNMPSVNRNAKPRVEHPSGLYSSSSRSFSRTSSLENEVKDVPRNKTPQVNRNLKPSWAPTMGLNDENPQVSKNKKNEITSDLSRQETALKENLTITEQQLDKEEEFAALRARKGLEAEESKRIELQKKEEILLENIKFLEKKSKEKEEAWQALKEENMQMKRVLEEKEEEIRKEKLKELQAIEAKNAYMKEHIDSLRRQRKLEERRIDKEKQESSHLVSRKDNKQPSGSQKDDGLEKKAKYPSVSEYTVPLKALETSGETSTRGLSRSFSSPNIAQMVSDQDLDVPHKSPAVDRSLKPKIDHSFVAEVSSMKKRNLNPTYGNCPARPVTGLRNLGNTCYMNSTIQCLSNTDQFAKFFYSGAYRKFIRRNNKHSTNGEVSEEFGAIIIALWAGQYKSISPKDFKTVASKHIPMCVGSEQQDSHEFLVVLMDKLHADFNQGRDTEPLPDLDSLSDSVATEKFWNHHVNRNKSKVSESFEGLLMSQLSCLSCGKTSNSYEVFSCLSMPISSSRCFFNDCLKKFLKPERMSGEAAWGCPSCKQKKEAEKSLVFCKLPDVLIIQLKRFSYEGLWRSKIQAYVDFPVSFEMPCNSRPRSYNLYGIVNHFGYLEGGHYTACCKNPNTGRWYKYDDSEVSEISSCDIHTSAAYLLFYSAQGSRM